MKSGMKKKTILICNDDGLRAPGLRVLCEVLEATGRYHLLAIAPDREQSGMSHCLTVREAVEVWPVTLSDELKAVEAFETSGTPADSVKLGILSLFVDREIDLVVAGINPGVNAGTLVHYSGTVACAFEARLCGIPAIAISIYPSDDGVWRFDEVATSALSLIDAILERGLPPETILNLNYPGIPVREMRGFKLTEHGVSGFLDERFVEEPSETGKRRFHLRGEIVLKDETPETDFLAIQQGWISVTPLSLRWEQRASRAEIGSLLGPGLSQKVQPL